MASRNYYVVLGVASTESHEGIRAAFRELAKQHHPDHVGPTGASAFREIAEAYDVLRDPARRRAYDRSLIPARATSVSLRNDLVEARPSADALFDRLARNFTDAGGPKGERIEELNVDVAISEEDAGRGTRLHLRVPVFTRCDRCRGRGCIACGSRGAFERERPVSFDVPPMCGSGTTFVVPLRGLGVHNFYVRVRVRVDKAIEQKSQ